MKKFNPINFLHLLILLVVSAVEVRANPISETEKAGREVIENLSGIESLNQNVKKVGMIEATCLSCSDGKSNLVVKLEGENIDLGNPYFRKVNEPFIILLKRTAKTPPKIDLKFKNDYKFCGKMFAGSNPWNPNGPLVIECAIYLTGFEEEVLSLNFKKLKQLKDGEEEIIEVRLTKPNLKNSKYDMSVKNISTPEAKEDIGKKFFGGGHNVSFDLP